MLEGYFTERHGILPSVPWPTSVGWYRPGPPALALIVLNDSLRLRVPTDRLRRKFRAPTRRGGEGLPVLQEPAYVTSAGMDAGAQAHPSE